MIEGGFPDLPRYAEGGGRTWERAMDETLEAFEERVVGDARAARLHQIIFGGLPPAGTDLGTLEEFLSRYHFEQVPEIEPR